MEICLHAHLVNAGTVPWNSLSNSDIVMTKYSDNFLMYFLFGRGERTLSFVLLCLCFTISFGAWITTKRYTYLRIIYGNLEMYTLLNKFSTNPKGNLSVKLISLLSLGALVNLKCGIFLTQNFLFSLIPIFRSTI